MVNRVSSLVPGQDPDLDARSHEVGHGTGHARLQLVLDRAGPDNLKNMNHEQGGENDALTPLALREKAEERMFLLW